MKKIKFQIIMLITLLIVIKNDKKKCKNPVECYADAIQILEVDREFLRNKMLKCGDNAGKIVEQVKLEIQAQFKQETEKKNLDMEELIKKNTKDILDIYQHLERMDDKLKSLETEKNDQIQDIYYKYDQYKKEVNLQILNVQQHIKNMLNDQEQIKKQTTEIEQLQQKQNQEVTYQISELSQEQNKKIEEQTIRMEKQVVDNDQVTEFKLQIKQLQSQLSLVKKNGDEIKDLQIGLDEKHENENKKIKEIEKELNNKEYIDEKIQELNQQLSKIQSNNEEMKQQQNQYQKQVLQMDVDYQQRVKSNQEQFIKRLDDLISKNELIVELQEVKKQFGGILQLQEQMKFNLTHINIRGKEHEKEQQRQFNRIGELSTRSNQNDNLVKFEINKELLSIKEQLNDILKKQEFQKQKQDKITNMHSILHNTFETKNTQYEAFQTQTINTQAEFIKKDEIFASISQMKEKIADLLNKFENVNVRNAELDNKHNLISNNNKQKNEQIQELQQNQQKLQNEIKVNMEEQLKIIQQQIDELGVSFEQIKTSSGNQNVKNEQIEKQVQILMQRVADLLDDKPDPLMKKFENLSRKEVNVQLKIVLESLRQIKKSHEDLLARHSEISKRQKDHADIITNQQNDLKTIKSNSTRKRRLKKNHHSTFYLLSSNYHTHH